MKKYLPLLLFGFFFFVPHAHATNTITFNASSTKATTASTNPSSTIAVGTGSNFALFACQNTNAAGDNVTAMTVSSTAGKFPMTFVASTTAGTRPAFIYDYVTSTMTAQTLTVSTTINASVKGNIGLSSFFGVNIANPIDQVNSVLMAGTTNVTTSLNLYVADEYAIDCVSTNGTPDIEPQNGQTVTASTSAITPTIRTGFLHFTNPSSSVIGWTLSPSALADYLVVGVQPNFVQTSTISIIASSTATPTIALNSATASFTTVSGTNTLLTMSVVGGNAVTSTGATFNGVAMTNAVENRGSGIGSVTIEQWYLVNPPVGTFTVSTTYPSGTGKLNIIIDELNNVNQSTPVDATSSFQSGSNNTMFNITPNQANDFGIDVNDSVSTGFGSYQTLLHAFTVPTSGGSSEVAFNDTSTVGFAWAGTNAWGSTLFAQASAAPSGGATNANFNFMSAGILNCNSTLQVGKASLLVQ